LENFEKFVLDLTAKRNSTMKMKNFGGTIGSLAQENAKNIMTTVGRYYNYLSSTLKRVSKRKKIFPDLYNALLKEDSSYEPAKITEILARGFNNHENDFIRLLIDHRQLLNPKIKSSNVHSDFTRLLLLQVLCEQYNKAIDRLPEARDERKRAQKFKRKVYCLLPSPELRADTKRHFLDLTPQAAAGFFWDFAAVGNQMGYVNAEGEFEQLSFSDYEHVWRFYTDIFNPSCRALNLAQN
jgi:hypothetical protein